MYLAIIILPLLGAIVSGFFGRKIGVTGSQIVTSGAVIATTILATIAFLEVGFSNISVSLHLVKWIDSESLNVLWGFNFDSLTVSMLIPVLIVSSLVHVYSIGYMSHDPHNQRFFSYLSLFTFMMVILVTSNNFLSMFVGWEGVGICSYLLVSFWYTRIAANQSSLSAFLTNRVGDCFLTIGMFSILWSFGNIDYNTVFILAPYINENIITIIGICLLIGAMAKSSQVGLHVWLPMAMEGPTPVSALIHAATMVTAGVYLLMRSSPLIEYSSTVLILCLWIGAITTVFSSLIGLFQQDIKKVIAYSTMSQLGMMVIAVGLSSYNIALFHLVNHAFYKALLFLGAGSVIHAVADNQDFRRYGGLKQFLPLTYSVMLIASLSLVAFPYMTGFYSKDFILESAYGQFTFSGTSVYYIATIGAMFTTLYSVKVLYLTFLTNPNGSLNNYKNVHESDIYMSLPLIVLAVFSIFFGYLTRDIFIGLGSGFFIDNSLFIHPSHEIMINTEFGVNTIYKLLPLFFTISLSVLAITISELLPSLVIRFKFSRFGYNLFGFFNQRFFIEMFYNKYISNVILDLGGQTTKILDKGSIELIGPSGLEKVLIKLSRNLSTLDTGVVTSYALYILLGLIFYILVPYIPLSDVALLFLIIFAIFSNINITSNRSDQNYSKMPIFESKLPSYLAIILAQVGITEFGPDCVEQMLAALYSMGPKGIIIAQVGIFIIINTLGSTGADMQDTGDVDKVTDTGDATNTGKSIETDKSTQPEQSGNTNESNESGNSNGSGGSDGSDGSRNPDRSGEPDVSNGVQRILAQIEELLGSVEGGIDRLERELSMYTRYEEIHGIESELLRGVIVSDSQDPQVYSTLNSMYESLNTQLSNIRRSILNARMLQDQADLIDPANAGDITEISDLEDRLYTILVDYPAIFPDPYAHASPPAPYEPDSPESLSDSEINRIAQANQASADENVSNTANESENTNEPTSNKRRRDSDDDIGEGPSKRTNV